MGIKTRFSSMGGNGGEPYASIPSAWSYTERVNEKGKNTRTLYFYNVNIGGTDVTVPYGHTELQDYYSSTNTNVNTLPFYNKNTITSVDLKKVSFRNNSIANAFRSCHNLKNVNGINKNVRNMAEAFYGCYNFNQPIIIPNSVTNMYYSFNLCYNFNQPITIPNSVQDMRGTFCYCSNFNQPITISNSVTNMYYTFFACHNFNQLVTIPNSVIDMRYAFYYCSNFNQPITIPNSVTNMYGTFSGCNNFNQPITIPNSVTNMYETFRHCINFNQPITIPNSVTNMASTFYYCNNFNQPITIPNSVTNTTATFYYCKNFNQPITIPNSVTNMYNTFVNCRSMGGNNQIVRIKSEKVSSYNNAFEFTSYYNMSNQLRVIYPLKYINNVNTVTYNSLVTAGYKVGAGTGITTANATMYYNLLAFDWIGGDYNTYTGNGTHWILSKWNGKLNTLLNNGVVATDITVPHEIESYDTFPTALNYPCFQANTVITSVDIGTNIPWAGNITGHWKNGTSHYGAFKGCSNLVSVNGTVNSSVTNVNYMFFECFNLSNANIVFQNGITTMHGTFDHCTNLTNIPSIPHTAENIRAIAGGTSLLETPEIPNSVTNMLSSFCNCNRLETVKNIGTGVTQLFNCFNASPNIKGDMYIKSKVVANIDAFLTGHNASRRLNVYIPYMQDDGDGTYSYTTTYTKFNANTFYHHNETTNVYMKDCSPYNSVQDYVVTVSSPNLYLNAYRGEEKNVKVINSSPFNNETVYFTPTTFNNKDYIESIDFNHVPITGTTMLNAVRDCTNLKSVTNLTIPSTVTTLQDMFTNCQNLTKASSGIGEEGTGDIEIPDNVTSARALYSSCKSLNTVYCNSINVTDLSYFVDYCNTRDLDIHIKSPKVSTIANFQRGYSASYTKNLYIPFMNADGTYTTTHNSFNAAVYLNNTASGFYRHDTSPYNSVADYVVTVNATTNTLQLGAYRGVHAQVKMPNVSPFPQFSQMKFVPATFYNNDKVEELDCNNVPLNGTTALNTFRLMANIKSISNINLPDGVTTTATMFYESPNLASVSNLKMPNTVTIAYAMYGKCYALSEMYINSTAVTNMMQAFEYCNKISFKAQIESRSVATLTNTFRGTVTSKDKYLFIHFRNDDGTYSKTFNTFKGTTYMGTTGNNTSTYMNMRYNSTSNYYLFDIDGMATNLNDFEYTETDNKITLTSYVNYGPGLAGNPAFSYPYISKTINGKNVEIGANCFSGRNQNYRAIFFNEVPIVNGDASYMFANASHNSFSIYGLNNITNMSHTFQYCQNFNQPMAIPNGVVNMSNTFARCDNFNQPVTIPNTVQDMAYTFEGCVNFNQPITIPNSVTNMHQTFESCNMLNKPITIGSNVIAMTNTFEFCRNFNQPITIPNSVQDMSCAFRYCLVFNQNITIPNSVTNMYSTFCGCWKFNQNITIPNSVTDIDRLFDDCETFNQAISIPDSVTSMGGTFYNCQKFNQPITIPNKVTSVYNAFYNCIIFNQPITIPNSVTNMRYTFVNCNVADITVESTEVSDAYNMINKISTTASNISYYNTYKNGQETLTSKTFKNYSSGWNGYNLVSMGSAPW